MALTSELTQRGPAPGPGWPIRVLLADDDREARNCLAQALRERGCEVVEACSGVEAVECIAGEQLVGLMTEFFSLPIAAHPFDVVIVDEALPEMTGREVLTQLSHDVVAPPVILTTAADDGALKDDARERGAVAVFGKPLEPGDVYAAIQGLHRPGDRERRSI